MSRRARTRVGFTLVEVMVALAVSGVGLAGVAALSMSSAYGTSYARHATEATILAEDQLERLLGRPGAQLASGADQVDAQGVATTTGGFTRTWTVTWNGDLAHLAVTVAWREGDGPRELAFAGVRTR